ncbi:MAG: class I SAM-dependent methyltransferase [Candidatus Eremiobacteraeota bacterium]|nr:class I SAM-dependent methyltransferase [Candidatus Eremiobacteraeota bacterium]
MRASDAAVYRSPASGEALSLDIHDSAGDDVIGGELRTAGGERYPIVDGIPDLTYPPDLAGEDATARTVYDSVASVYDEYLPLTFQTFGCDEGQTRELMVERLRLVPGQRVLEVGAGTGRTSAVIAAKLHDRGHIYVHDISRGILQKAVERLSREAVPLSFLISNGIYLPFADDSFDAVFHFGGLNMFSDIRRGLSEMARVVRPGGRVVVGDESVPPWLRETNFGKVLIATSSHYGARLPLEEMPVAAREVAIEYILGGAFYLISFTVGEGEPAANFDLPIPGVRGGTHRTRAHGQLEGVTLEAKRLAQRAREKRGISMHAWLDEAVREAARRDLEE